MTKAAAATATSAATMPPVRSSASDLSSAHLQDDVTQRRTGRLRRTGRAGRPRGGVVEWPRARCTQRGSPRSRSEANTRRSPKGSHASHRRSPNPAGRRPVRRARGTRSQQAIPAGRQARRRRCQPACPPRRVAGDHGPVGLRQVDPAADAGRAHDADQRHRARGGYVARRLLRIATGPDPPPPYRIRLPALQPDRRAARRRRRQPAAPA